MVQLIGEVQEEATICTQKDEKGDLGGPKRMCDTILGGRRVKRINPIEGGGIVSHLVMGTMKRVHHNKEQDTQEILGLF